LKTCPFVKVAFDFKHVGGGLLLLHPQDSEVSCPKSPGVKKSPVGCVGFLQVDVAVFPSKCQSKGLKENLRLPELVSTCFNNLQVYPQEMLKTNGFLRVPTKFLPKNPMTWTIFHAIEASGMLEFPVPVGPQGLPMIFIRAHIAAHVLGKRPRWAYGLEVEFAGNISEASLELVGS
jgi:hypothetical protein